jgi:hypothetical protein
MVGQQIKELSVRQDGQAFGSKGGTLRVIKVTYANQHFFGVTQSVD